MNDFIIKSSHLKSSLHLKLLKNFENDHDKTMTRSPQKAVFLAHHKT